MAKEIVKGRFYKDVNNGTRSGRWLLIGADSTKAKGCIRELNNDVIDERCLSDHSYYCYRFINPHKLTTCYHTRQHP